MLCWSCFVQKPNIFGSLELVSSKSQIRILSLHDYMFGFLSLPHTSLSSYFCFAYLQKGPQFQFDNAVGLALAMSRAAVAACFEFGVRGFRGFNFGVLWVQPLRCRQLWVTPFMSCHVQQV